MTRSNIELGDVTPHNIKQLKKLNSVVFPVSYNEKFYIDVLEAVGAVCCRIDTSENQRRLYIMTLGCLSSYRRLGIGTVMFQHILNYAKVDGNFDSIFLHVQINNEGAIAFYKKFGFEIVETKEHYYKRIEPADAYVLQKTLRNTNSNASGTISNHNHNPAHSNGHLDKKEKKA
nr:probable N-acetyltransferase san isoform X2 [Bactrocera oleae]